MTPLDQGAITTIVLILTPLVGILIVMANLFNLGKKEVEEIIDNVGQYIHKRKAENILKIIFPGTINTFRDGQVEANDETIRTLVMNIEQVDNLEKSMDECSRYCEFYYGSLMALVVLGVALLITRLVGVNVEFLRWIHNLVDSVIIVYVVGGFVVLWIKKYHLKKLYGKEFTI